MIYKSKYSTKFTCNKCGYVNIMPCNFCSKCGEKLIKDTCLYCWKRKGKTIKTKAKSCGECNICKYE